MLLFSTRARRRKYPKTADRGIVETGVAAARVVPKRIEVSAGVSMSRTEGNVVSDHRRHKTRRYGSFPCPHLWLSDIRQDGSNVRATSGLCVGIRADLFQILPAPVVVQVGAEDLSTIGNR